MEKLLIASTNKGKIKEVRAQLKDFNFEIIGLDNFPELMNIKEDGETFSENALKKARVSAKKTNLITLADDSGLEVDYLNGKPGIYSARFSGKNATDEENNKKLLKELEDVEKEKRTARFRCVMAIYDPHNDYHKTVDGNCEGRILKTPRGENGFGYDPLFFVESKGKTMAELAPEIKNKISHRANALEKMKKIIKEEFCS
ncbi:MAG TPA: XTP/dITP diphosphatase [Halanaerobiales bacterium]|nr:XTP/dITP diphosphatase [Halanaerobiales bacterium]